MAVTIGVPRLVFVNRADNGTVTASTELLALPATHVLDANINKVWRASASTGFIDLDMGADFKIQVVAGIHLPKSTLSYRVRIGASPGASDAYDSGTITAASAIHVNTQQFIEVSLVGATGRYVRVDLDCGTGLAEMGRLVVGGVYELKFGVSHTGHEPTWRDLSKIAYSVSGVKYVDIRPRQRGIRFTSRGDSYEEVRQGVEEVNRICGISRDFLFILDPNATALLRSRDAIWGSMEESSRIMSIEQGVYQFEIEMWARV